MTVGAILLGALAACSAPDPAPLEPRPTATTSVRPDAPTTAAPDPTTVPEGGIDRFVMLVREKLPTVAVDRRDEEVAALVEETCDGLAAGREKTAVISSIRQQGLAAPDARALVDLVKDSACPT